MVTTKNVETLVTKLKDVFCGINADKKYSEVWLSDVDFGDLYQPEKYILNIKTETDIPSCNDEIKFISDIIFKKLPNEQRSYIWRIVVYNASEQIHCVSENMDKLVFNPESESCE